MRTRYASASVFRTLALLALLGIAAAPAAGSLQDAVDNTTLTFGNDPGPANEQWHRVTDVSHDGVDAARSGSWVGDGDDSGFSATVTGPGTISFWWKVSSEAGQDLLYYIRNATYDEIAFIGGEVDWEYREFSVPAGEHTLYWSYMKNYQYAHGSDCGWVDQIVWTPGSGGDTTPPGDVTDFTLTPGDGRVYLNWANPGDADLAGVRILRRTDGWPTGPTDGASTVVYDGNGEEATDYNLINGLRHYYMAFAYDAVPNYAAGVQKWTHPGQAMCCGLTTGFVARAQFEEMYASFGGHYIDFDNFANRTRLDTQLQAAHGVTFWTTKDSTGNPLATPHNVIVSDDTYTSPSRSIVGTPSAYSYEDGRYAYEARFDEPQRWAGITRCWSTWSENQVTRFYSPSGALLAEGNVYPQNFVGYVACSSDTNDWVARIECDGIASARQPGYSDDLFFGTGPGVIGDVAWSYFYDDGGADHAYDVALDGSGDAYVAGSHTEAGDPEVDALFYKITPGSNTYTWAEYRSLPGEETRSDRYHDVCIDDQGNAIAVGYLASVNAFPWVRTLVTKFAPDGSNHWEHTWYDSAGGGTEAYAYGVDIAPDGTLYVGAQVDVGADNDFRWEVLEYAPTGFVGVISSMIYHAPDSSYDYRNIPFGLAVHDDHSICQVGRVGDNANTRVNWHVRYYDGNHDFVWADTITAPVAGKHGYAFDVDMDAAGNPVAAGYINMPGDRADGLVVKYDAATGDELWRRTCAQGESCGFTDVDVVDDAVLVSGWCRVAGKNHARLLALDAGDGAVLVDKVWDAGGGYARAAEYRDGRIAVAITGGSDAGVAILDIPDTTDPEIVLQGDNPLELARGTAYAEPGYTATDDVDGDITGNVVVTGSVDHTTVGAYRLYYNVSDAAGNPATEQVRTVNVVDQTPPEIVLQGDNPLELEAGTAYAEPGYTATDDVDGDVTGNVAESGNINHAVVGTYMRYYDVSDAAGNAATQQVRTVNVVDTTPPSITLQGDHPMELERGTAYVEPGYTAEDPFFGDLTGSVTVTGHVDHTVNGTYTLHYNVADAEGNPAPEQVRTVNVIEPLTGPPPAPSPVGPSGTITDRTPDFTWDPAARAVWYQLVIEKDGKSYFKKWFKGLTTWTPGWDLKPGDYTWEVRAWNPDGFGPWSAPALFDIPAMIPGKPTLYDPTGTINSGLPVFDWEDDSDAAWWHLIVQRAGKTVIDKWIQGVSDYTPTDPLRYGYYAWYVRGWGLDGLGPWSDKGSFDYGVTEPLIPADLSDVYSPFMPTFSWESVDGATWYNLWILRNHEFYYKKWVNLTEEWTPTWELPPGTYTWYVRAWGPEGLMGPWSWDMIFFIGAPVLLEPQGVLTGPPTEIVWDDTESSYALWYKAEFFNQDTYARFSCWVERTDTTAVGDERTALLPPKVSPLPSGRYMCFLTPWYKGGLGGGSYPIEFTVP